MNMPVNNKFSILVGQKRVQEKRSLPLTEIAKETGVSYPTLLAWANNRVTRYDVSVIDALAQYFGLTTIGDLLEYVEHDYIPPATKKKAARK